MKYKLISILVHLLSSSLLLGTILFMQDGFGSGDVYAFFRWSLALSISVAIFGQKVINPFKHLQKPLKVFPFLILAMVLTAWWVLMVYGILGSVLLAFSFPVYYLWAVGVFTQLLVLELDSKKYVGKRRDIFLVLLGFPIVSILLLLIVSMLTLVKYFISPIKVDYIIPKGFEGKFVVAYGMSCGITAEVKEGRTILHIPENGILLLKDKAKEGILDYKYYLGEEGGEEIFDSLNNDKGIVLYGGYNYTRENEINNNSATEEYESRTAYFTDFYMFRNGYSKEKEDSSDTPYDGLEEILWSCDD